MEHVYLLVCIPESPAIAIFNEKERIMRSLMTLKDWCAFGTLLLEYFIWIIRYIYFLGLAVMHYIILF